MYISPAGFPEGNDAAFFVTKFFWLLAQGYSPQAAFEASSKDMPSGSEFILIDQPPE
jgi:hypothetical protein